ncbi:hypothetical protein Tco_0577291, partial [Tanacetum coccineum]
MNLLGLSNTLTKEDRLDLNDGVCSLSSDAYPSLSLDQSSEDVAI